MDQQLKTRLIGVTIIVSLVVIFIPMLFEDSSEQESADVGSASIPEFPQDFQSQTLPLPSSSQGMASTPTPSKSDMDPLPAAAPTHEEPLDPLDVPIADEGEGREMSSEAQDAMPIERPVKPAGTSPPPAAAVVTTPPKPNITVKEAAVKPLEKAKTAVVPESAVKAAPPVTARSKVPVPSAKPVASAPNAPVKMTAWVIQVGSFGDEANAKSLLIKLRQANINAFVEMIPSSTGNSYRVRVGPELDRARAEATLKKMESGAGVKGMIVPYP